MTGPSVLGMNERQYIKSLRVIPFSFQSAILLLHLYPRKIIMEGSRYPKTRIYIAVCFFFYDDKISENNLNL